MARRRKTSPFDDLVSIAAKLPWWLNLPLAGASYLWLHPISLRTYEAKPGIEHMQEMLIHQAITVAAMLGQVILPAAFVFAAVLNIAQRLKKRSASKSETLVTPPAAFQPPQARQRPFAEPVTQAPVADLSCPLCHSPMVVRVAKRGGKAGNSFFGCSRFPDCRGTRQINS